MRCTIISHVGYSPQRDRHEYVLQADNGLVAKEEAQVLLRVGTSFDLPDEEWSPDTEEYDLRCDDCGYEYSKRATPGFVVACPICGTEEKLPDESTQG